MRVKKVINNNILCVVDEQGKEMIVTGRGIGFGRQVGERVREDQVEKTYRMEGTAEQRKLMELVEQIPIEHIRLTQELIEDLREQLSQKLNEGLLITLADHISFALQRKEQGLTFENPLKGAIMSYYPAEYQAGVHCLKTIEERCRTRLHPDEASFIALHIVNAEWNTEMSQMYQITELLENCVKVTEFYYQEKFDRNSLAFSRFAIHLRYLIQRLFQNQGQEEDSGEKVSFFRKLVQENCRRHYECARRIGTYIETNYGKKVSEEELVYLTIHLKRLHMNEEAAEPGTV